MSTPAKKFNLVEEINSTFRGRSSAVTSKPVTAEAFIPVEPKKKRLGSFLMSFMSSDEEAEYEPEPPRQEIDWKSLDFKRAEPTKETVDRNPKRKLDEATEKELFGDRLERVELEREISDLQSKFFLLLNF